MPETVEPVPLAGSVLSRSSHVCTFFHSKEEEYRVLEDLPGVHDIVEYEARLNHILPDYHDPVICTYDLSRFDGSVVIDNMRTHPMVIIGGIGGHNAE